MSGFSLEVPERGLDAQRLAGLSFVSFQTLALALLQIVAGLGVVEDRSASRALSAILRRSLPSSARFLIADSGAPLLPSAVQPPSVAASNACSAAAPGAASASVSSSSALRPGKRLIRSRIFLPIFAASPATGTMPAADHAASPNLPLRERGDQVADVADREEPGEDLAGEVLEAGADRIVVVRALPERRVAADRAARRHRRRRRCRRSGRRPRRRSGRRRRCPC